MDGFEVKCLENGFRHLAMQDVGSTNAVCLEHAQAGDAGNLWVTADRQTSGRGSRGRTWVSQSGNLYASLLLREPGPSSILHTLTFAASLAIRDAIYSSPGAQFAEVTLKWPNDVLLNGKKTSGILLESHVFSGVRFVIIGMGINISHHPDDTLHPATHLAENQIEIAADQLFQQLNHHMQIRLVQWDGGEGFGAVREDWLAAAAGLNRTIEIRLPNEPSPRTGIFNGIDNDGLLILGCAGGRTERISVADIFFA